MQEEPEQTSYTTYDEPQTDYPNIKVTPTDDIIFEKPVEEDFFTKYNRMNFGEKFGKYWWFVLLSLLLPLFWLVPALIGAVSVLSYKSEKRKFIVDLFALALIGLIILG
jgi:hypothetical protein